MQGFYLKYSGRVYLIRICSSGVEAQGHQPSFLGLFVAMTHALMVNIF